MARLLPPERDIGVLHAPVRACLALTGIFLLVLLAVGLMERIGVDPGAALSAVVGAAFALFALAALLSHSRRAADFYVADRKISGAFGGLAAAGSFAGLIAIGLAGGSYSSVAEFLAAATAFVVGYLVLAAVIAPRMRSFGAYAPGDVLGARFGGVWVRLAWAAIAFIVSFFLLLAHLKVAGPLLSTLLRITPGHALYATAGLTLLAVLPGGMRSLTWTQAIQYFVIAVACLAPAVFLLVRQPPPENVLAPDLGALLADNLYVWSGAGMAESALPAVLAALGAASLPHLMARTLTAPSRREAGTSMVWGVLFSALLVLAGVLLAGLLSATADPEPAISEIDRLGALLVTLPAVLSGLVLAGALAALFALGQAALFSAASALSHDVFDEVVDRRGPEGRRIAVARLILVGVAAVAATLAPLWPIEAPALVEWALAFAVAGGFAPLVLGLWWRRCNEIGAVSGMAVGFGLGGVVFLMAEGGLPLASGGGWATVGAPAAAVASLLMSALVTIGLSLATSTRDADAERPIRERPA